MPKPLSRVVALTVSLTIAASISLTAAMAQPLVDVGWLKERIGRPGYVILDFRSAAGLTRNVFEQIHIPGSVYSDYRRDGWRVRNGEGVRGIMGPISKLEALIGSLGVSNNSHVILVANGHSSRDMATATRVYWTFKVLGHDRVSVLNGGFLAWIKSCNPKTGQPLNRIASGKPKIIAKTFKANFRPGFLATRKDVAGAAESKTILVDNRSHDYFMGLSKSSSTKTSGTLQGASVLPHSWLISNSRGTLRSPSELETIYEAAKIPVSGKQITFCNTGHLATLGWFVSSEILGNKEARLYDGSMADWTNDASRPVQRISGVK